MSLKKEMATGEQYAQYGLLIAQSVVKRMGGNFSKDEMQELLTGSQKGKSEEIAKQIVTKVLDIKISIWNRQVEKLNKFWKDQFSHIIDWNSLTIPEQKKGFKILEYIPSCFTEDDIFNKYAELFGKDKVWKLYDNILNTIKDQQSRPACNRLVLHRGGQEPDAEHLNRSYNDFCSDGKQYMIPIEGLIVALRYRVEIGKMLDVNGLTRFHALDSGGLAMCMYGSDGGGFCISRFYRDDQHSACGPREVVY